MSTIPFGKSGPYTLWLSQRSPFARRVKLALERLRVAYQERLTEPFAMEPEFLAANPLGLVPTVSGGGLKQNLMESTLILDFLDENYGGKIWPTSQGDQGDRRWLVRRSSVIASGLMQVAVQRFLETHRTSPDGDWLEDHALTVERGLEDLERGLGFPLTARVDQMTQAHWDWAVLLDYLDFRWPELGWTTRHRLSVQVLELALRDPTFSATRPKLPIKH